MILGYMGLSFLYCPLQSSLLSVLLLELKDQMCLAALLCFGMLVGKWQEQELLPGSVPSCCQIRAPTLLCSLGREHEDGKKGRDPARLGAAALG